MVLYPNVPELFTVSAVLLLPLLMKAVEPPASCFKISSVEPPDTSVANVAFPLKSPIKLVPAVPPINIDAVIAPLLALYFNLP